MIDIDLGRCNWIKPFIDIIHVKKEFTRINFGVFNYHIGITIKKED